MCSLHYNTDYLLSHQAHSTCMIILFMLFISRALSPPDPASAMIFMASLGETFKDSS